LTEDRLGPDHVMVAEIASRLGTALYSAGHPKDAAPHRIRAVSIQWALDADSIMTSATMADSLHILDAAGEWATALEYAQALVQRFGADTAHGDFGLECRIWLPYLYTRVGELEKAGPLLDELMAAEGEMDDLQRARLHYAKGVWCQQRGEPEQARSHLGAALKERGDKPNHWPPPSMIREAIDSLGTPDER
jgi:tetratricopeptide (TPR) repeat protein